MKRLSVALSLSFLLLVRSPGAVVPGHVEAWGDNLFGRSTPPRFNDIIAISAGLGHALALRSNGTVVAWGSNGQGETDVPPGLTNVIAISARLHSVALKADGTVVVWGSPHPIVTNVPPDLTNVVQVCAGGWANGNAHTLALRSDGTVLDWGILQDGTTPPPGLQDLVQVAAGNVHALALKRDGTVVAWGTHNPGSAEIVPPGLSNIVVVRAGQTTSFVLRSDGTLFRWGGSDDNAIPDGVSGVTDFSLGNQHVIALRTNGTVLAWANNQQGGVPFGLNGVSAVSAGGDYNLVLTPRPLIDLISPPIITTVGSAVTLQVEAVGEPLAYQWFRRGVPVPGATTGSLVLNPIAPAQGGAYAVLISNPYGTTVGNTSVSFPPPTITAQPQNLQLYRGETATFNVTVDGLSPFSYRWFKDSVQIPGATNSSYSIPRVDPADASAFKVIIEDIAGGTLTSDAAKLTVIDPRGETFLNLKPQLDASIFSASSSNPQGDATILSGTRQRGILDRGLLRFDLSALPTNAVIDSATVELTIVKAPRSLNPSNFRLHRLLKPWDSSVTWEKPGSAATWSTPGGAPGLDYVTSGTPGIESDRVRFSASGEMLTDVRDWIAESQSNFGWILVSDNEAIGGTARHFGSGKSATPPTLVLGYAFPAPPPVMTGMTIESNDLVFQVRGNAGWIYQIQTRENIDRGEWIVLTNAPAGAALSPIIIRAPLSDDHQFFRAVQN